MSKKNDKRPFWTVDCETDPFKHGRVPKPFIWGLYTGATFHEFATVQELVEFIKDCDVIVYAHNGGKFDFHFLLEHLNLGEKVTVINGRLVVGKIGKCELRDSWNILPVALGVFKKDDFDYTKLEEEVRHLHTKEIREYLRNDCVYLYELIEAFERKNGRCLTQAGAAMRAWEEISGLKKPKTDRWFFEKFVKYYYGGRVQCFQKGKIDGPIELYDIKSSYPSAMLDPHPYDPEYVTTSYPKEFKSTSMVTVDCVSHGHLPFRNEHGSIIFPADKELRRYYVCGHELQMAIDTNNVSQVKLIEAIDFTDLVSFAPFINNEFDQRAIAIELGNKADDILHKLRMNGLSGKFGANPDNYGNYILAPFQDMEDYEDENYSFDGMIGPHALMRAPLEEYQQHYINVATIASITSQARAKLSFELDRCFDPIYCDTDSIACRAAPNLDIGKKLGQWGHEGTADTMWIAGKKMYLCDGLMTKNPRTGAMEPKQATKGVKLTAQQIRNASMGMEELYRPEAPTFSLRRKPDFVNRRIRMTG